MEPKKSGKKRSDGWEERGGYMNVKIQKLGQQFEEVGSKRKSNIFKGVSIWVNGYTEPSSDELRRLMGEHGGKYQHFFSKTHVTHIIATNLPNSKVKDLKRNDRVVHPDWILHSVKAARLLPIDKYLLYSVNKRDGTVLQVQNNTLSALNHSKMCAHSSGEIVDVKPSEEVVKDIPYLSRHDYTTSSTSALKAGDTNFISEFYSHSRLHHLSMWKAELRKYAASIHKKKSVSGKSSRKKIKGPRVFMHIDMDSFFVSVALKVDRQLIGKPVAVCHAGQKTLSETSSSWSSVASCSYEARKFGVRNGMMLHKARAVCPALVCVPYHFDLYREVSQKVYEILSGYTFEIEAVSCDEALLDVTDVINEKKTALEIAELIRQEIYVQTQCTASCGVAPNILLARLATKKAKPNGVYQVVEEDVADFIAGQNVHDLPGIGWAQGKKLDSLSITTCAQLQTYSLFILKDEFGPKFGETLYNFCRGVDTRELQSERERKSVSAEINYGMRFEKMSEVEKFVLDLGKEVENRLKEVGKKGKFLTFKLMVKRKDANAPLKYMGHGLCDSTSRSTSLPQPSDSADVIAVHANKILHLLTTLPQDIRGMGIQMTKLTDSSLKPPTVSLYKFTKPLSALSSHESTLQDNATTNSLIMPALPFTGLKSPAKNKVLDSDLWDVNVLNELPVDIQRELLEQKDKQCRKVTTPSKANTNNNCPEQKKKKKSPANKLIFSKSNIRGRPKKLYETFDSTKYRDIRCGNLCSNSTLLSPSRVDFNVVNELPEDIKNEVLSNLKPSKSFVKSFDHEDLNSSFLNAMPDDIRREILQEHSAANLHIGVNTKANIPEDVPFIKDTNSTESMHDLLSPSQLDPTVLDALPNDVRREVVIAARSQKNKRLRQRENNSASEVLKEKFTSEDIKFKQVLPSLQGADTLVGLKQLVKRWVQSIDDPFDEDIADFTAYLHQLIHTRNLETLDLLLKSFRRTVSCSPSWCQKFNFILRDVQSKLKDRYQGRLGILPCS